MISLVEFLAPLMGSSHRDKVLAILYYRQRYEGVDAMTADEIRKALGQARVPKWTKINVADVLAKSGHFVDSRGTRGSRLLWALTPTGATHVRTLLDLPESEVEVEHDAGALEGKAAAISDPIVRGYVQEAVKCLKVGALRACCVFLWIGAIRVIHERLLSSGGTSLNAALLKHDPKSRHVGKIEDFAYVKDALALLAAVELGIVDKGEKQTLEECLNLRNRCGHPTKYMPGIKKVSSFVEDLTTIVFA